jgi:hypothetical protein
MELEIWIGSLQLKNMPPLDYERFGTALESELARLITVRGLPADLSGRSVEIGIDALQIVSHTTAEAFGIHLAQTVYEAFAT